MKNFACVHQGNVNLMKKARGNNLFLLPTSDAPTTKRQIFANHKHDLKFLFNFFNICCVMKCWPELSSNTALMISILIKHEIFCYSMFCFNRHNRIKDTNTADFSFVTYAQIATELTPRLPLIVTHNP